MCRQKGILQKREQCRLGYLQELKGRMKLHQEPEKVDEGEDDVLLTQRCHHSRWQWKWGMEWLQVLYLKGFEGLFINSHPDKGP